MILMTDKKNAPRFPNQDAPREDTSPQTTSQGTGKIEVRPTPRSQMRRLCPGCFPRRMTKAEIERYGLADPEAFLEGGGDRG